MFGKKSENILVVKTDTLTAFVAAEPYFEAIREANPNARISLLTIAPLQRIARAAPYFDQVAAMPDMRDVEAKRAFVKQLKASNFARIYNLSADDNARKLQAAMGPFGPKWVNAPSGRGSRSRGGPALPDVETLATSAGFEAPARRPDFSWAMTARKDSANMKPGWFGLSGTFALLMPSSDATRRWPAERYGEFARMLARATIMPVLIGPKEIHNFGDEVSQIAPEIVDLTGKTDHLQLAALARESAFFVSDAAEEVHLAVSVGCAGVLIKKSGEEHLSPEGRHVVTVTARGDLGEVSAEFIWRRLDNMDLIPVEAALLAAGAR